jgi:minor extracellular serine protease Vpr
MKIKLFLTFLILSISINIFSQQIFTDESRIIKIESRSEISKLSLSTKFILQEAKQNSTKFILKDAKQDKTNDLTTVNLNSLVRITLLFENDCPNFNIANIFSDISKISENISTAFVKVQDLPLLENIECLKYADIGENLELEVSNARAQTNTNSVHLGSGLRQFYTGTGVIVGIIDNGFDYTHPNFKDSNGNLRIKKVWEQSSTTGNSPSPFNYGSQFIGSPAILNKLFDITNESHGTHVTGIAAGSGNGNPSLLKGMAPDADIILVSRGGDLSGEIAGTSNSTKLVDAINYIKNYANSVSKPAVINMSFGTNLGPHDGTDLLSKSLNAFSTNQGLIMVKSAGNDGAAKKHAVNVFNGNQTKFILNTMNIGESKIDIWGDNQGVNSAFDVTIGVYNTINKTYDSSVIQFTVNSNLNFQNPYTLVDGDFGPLNNDNWTISLSSEINPLNNRPHLRISCNTLNDNIEDFLVVSIQSNGGTVHSWCDGKYCEFNNPPGFSFTDGDDYFSITEPGNAEGVITVGSYNVTDENLGNPPVTLGGLTYFSSKGPRTDFLIKPDVTAPGNRIISSINSYHPAYQSGGIDSSDVTNTFGNYKYAKMQGTSMAAPVVSGIIALWLQAVPQLTTNHVRTIIANTSITESPVSDSFLFYGTNYSTPPNIKWGYGKIDALAGMQLSEQALFKVVISQVYGGGGNTGAPYSNDYIELFNSGTVTQNLNGWSIQYTSPAGPNIGSGWSKTNLPDFTLQPGQYFLIKCDGSGTSNLPTEDATSTIKLGLSAGKVILVSNTTAETTANPTGAQIIDKVGYGTNTSSPPTTGYEGSGPTSTLLSNTTAAFRKLNGCTDSDSNPNDFIIDKPNPRNSASPSNTCSSLSASRNTLETVTLYPNPTNSKVFFDNTKSNFKEVAVYNYLGQEVARTNFITTSNNQEIDISNLAKGVYVFKLNNSEKSITLKIIKE